MVPILLRLSLLLTDLVLLLPLPCLCLRISTPLLRYISLILPLLALLRR